MPLYVNAFLTLCFWFFNLFFMVYQNVSCVCLYGWWVDYMDWRVHGNVSVYVHYIVCLYFFYVQYVCVCLDLIRVYILLLFSALNYFVKALL